MAELERYVPGVPCWVDVSSPDPDATVEFYKSLFGWDFDDAMPPGAPGKYFIARIRGSDVAAVGSQPEGGPPMAVWNTYVWVDSADETARKVEAAGGRVLMAPFDVTDAGRMAVFSDFEGAVFSVWQAGKHRGAQIINEHGSVNFNNLNTRDIEGAKALAPCSVGTRSSFRAFTRGRCGLRRSPREIDPGSATDGVSRRPAGFRNVVAALIRWADRRCARNWSVTFAVDDADAIAEKATHLGLQVVLPPVDAPWVRMTVITDPQGATFIASKFVPENKDLAAPSTSDGHS
jgi:predicted enzyme related to lactoylglutathione lyase